MRNLKPEQASESLPCLASAWMLGLLRVLTAFLYGVLLGVVWECASMAVLLAATLVEHLSGTLPMAIIFLGIAAGGFVVAARADLGRPLLSILAFRLTAQLAMTVGTGSVRDGVKWRAQPLVWGELGSAPCERGGCGMVAFARRSPLHFPLVRRSC